MLFEDDYKLTSLSVPEPDCVIKSGGSKSLPVR